jgi:TonB-dependent receptor
MNYVHWFGIGRRWTAACGLVFLMLTHVAPAQAPIGTGVVTGRVFEGATGRSLQGAIVTVVGTSISDYTDPDGRFQLSGMPAGTADIQVDYVGLDPLTQRVTITAGATTTLNAELKSEALKMATFEVAESVRGQALAINQQKTARGIMNIVSEEVFGAMNDGNIGYALQRLPGLSVNEDEDGAPDGVNIRGLPSEFNSFQVDGNRAAGRGFNMRNLVADGIANIEVIKAATPDRDGDAIGGIVNVVSRSAFLRDGREVRVTGSGVYQSAKDNWGYNTKVSYNDIFGIFGAEKNLGVSITATKYRTNRDYTNNDTDFNVLNKETNPSYNLPTDVFLYIPNMTIEDYLKKTNSYGANATFDFRIGPHHTFYFKPLYSHFDLTSLRYETRPYIDTRNENTLTGRKTFEVLTYNYARGSAGTNGSRGEIRYYGTQSDTTNDLYSLAAGGRHELGSLMVNYDAFASHSKYFRPRYAQFVVRNIHAARGYIQWEYFHNERLYPRANVVNGIDPRDLSGATVGNMTMEPESRFETTRTAKFDVEKKIVGEKVATALKVGAKYREYKPMFDQVNYSYTTGANFPYASLTRVTDLYVHKRPMYLEVDPQKAVALLHSSPSLFTYSTYNSLRATAVEDYIAKETTDAGYAMATFQMGRHTILGGVRVEHNTWEATRKTIDQASLRESPVHNGRSYTNWLPGIHFRHALRPNLILRESFNKSYGRPTLSRLTLGRSEDINGNVAVGNPNLDPTTSDNFDAQLEQYIGKGGLYSVGVFYKKMRGFYYNQIYKFNVLDANDVAIPDSGGTRTWQKWQNANGATNKGLELIANQKLFFLPKPFNGLGVQLSATFTDSVANYPDRPGEKLPTYGFSHYMFNSAVEYTYGNFRGRISYRYRSEYLEGIDTSKYIDDWFAAREQVDAEVSYRLFKKMRLFVNGENLTGRVQASYQGTLPYIEDNSNYGYRITVGAEYAF